MSILSSIGRIASQLNAAHTRYRSARSISSLPLELQKDIGWPETFDSKTGYRRGHGGDAV
ncbi:hypothetical protein [Aminobacter sp. AP02]|uniref:hypothetical protein n=1 Tax=Aminobacter sp. AP02 TaxID=2135737 RepID=UPI000D6C1F8E|nr:hypothetical protein [Aminobacter sp. AP02]PWK69104.1 hypothetical protein C8K44_109134 [Aminobacter sp. AP02]